MSAVLKMRHPSVWQRQLDMRSTLTLSNFNSVSRKLKTLLSGVEIDLGEASAYIKTKRNIRPKRRKKHSSQ